MQAITSLAIVLVGSFMAVLDSTIVNVALPSIGQGAHMSSGPWNAVDPVAYATDRDRRLAA
jgi:MFS family permease